MKEKLHIEKPLSDDIVYRLRMMEQIQQNKCSFKTLKQIRDEHQTLDTWVEEDDTNT